MTRKNSINNPFAFKKQYNNTIYAVGLLYWWYRLGYYLKHHVINKRSFSHAPAIWNNSFYDQFQKCKGGNRRIEHFYPVTTFSHFAPLSWPLWLCLVKVKFNAPHWISCPIKSHPLEFYHAFDKFFTYYKFLHSISNSSF